MKQTKSIVVALDYVDICRGPLVLVNREHPARQAAAVEHLACIAPGVRLEKQAALLYGALMREIGGAPHIVPVSGYRSRAEQERLYADALREHGAEYTAAYVALPGCSEHQTGLALHVGQQAEHIDLVAPDFPYAGICQQFRRAAARHGFVQRYPAGKEHITGIGHEPWHFRYVGIPHSEVMAGLGATLEEYTQWVRAYPWENAPCRFESRRRAFEIGFVPAHRGSTEIVLHGEPYTVSGNNVDGFVVAVWGYAT